MESIENQLTELDNTVNQIIESQPRELGANSFDFSSFEVQSPANVVQTENNSSSNSDSSTGNASESLNESSNTQSDSAMGEFALFFSDIIISRLAVTILNWQGYQCNFKDLSFSPDEKKTLRPIVDRLVKKYMLNLSDESMLIGAVLGMVGGKVLLITMSQEPKEKGQTIAFKPVASAGTSNPKGAGAHKKDCVCEKCMQRKNLKKV